MAASLEAKMKQCTKPHALAHSLTGLGVGFILIAIIPALSGSVLTLGILALVVGIAWDWMVNKG